MTAITYYLNGELYRVHGTPELSVAEIIATAVPADAENMQQHDELVYPEDLLFQEAWELQGSVLVEELAKSKIVAHDIRREIRDQEFLPWDRKVSIPSEAVAAEAERDVIRQKYAQAQLDIDAASDITVLRGIVKSFI
jgi:hypothetical protein